MVISEYEKQANDLLAKFGITFKAELIGKDCPRFCDDAAADRHMDKLDQYPRKSHIHGKHYRCTFHREGHTFGKDRQYPGGTPEANSYYGAMSIDFWNSYADEEYNELGTNAYRLGEHFRKYDRNGKRTPTAYDVLACLTKADPGTFEDFCGDFGYDSDSMRAHDTWKAVRVEWRKVTSFFYPKEITAIQEVQ